jgi:hypothetical protein
MLSKLLKYEFKSTSRKFLPLYGAIIIISIILNFGIRFPQMMPINMISGMVLFGLLVSLAIITLMTIIKRFKDNLLSDEGYLMFTLPVSSEKLILSKLITSIVWMLLSGILAIFSALLIIANKEFITGMSELFDEIPELLNYFKMDYLIVAILGLITFFTQTIYFILLIYTSLSVSQMAIFNKHRGIISFIAFIVLYSIVNSLAGIFFNKFFDTQSINDIKEIIPLLTTCIITNLSLCVVMFIGTNYLLKNHLNIE